MGALIAAARRGKFEVLLVWSFDPPEHGRGPSTVLDLDRRGVQVVSYKEPWLDTGGSVRSLLIGIFGWVAEQERLRIGDRTKAGLERSDPQQITAHQQTYRSGASRP